MTELMARLISVSHGEFLRMANAYSCVSTWPIERTKRNSIFIVKKKKLGVRLHIFVESMAMPLMLDSVM